MKSGKTPTLFPTPYPDELFYSVLCRYQLRLCNASTRSVSEELYGKRKLSNILLPQFINRIASLFPVRSGFTPEYFIQNTTIFPYFSPFLTAERGNVLLTYMKSATADERVGYFALGFGKLRQPQNERFRFCKSCWADDASVFGEPYWHRLHQLPGVMACHLHREPLFEVPVSFLNGSRDFYAASTDIIDTAAPCGIFSGSILEKLILLSADTAWLLQNGCRLGPYEETLNKYDRRLRMEGLRVWRGKTFHRQIHSAILESFGPDFLKLLNAYDASHNGSWAARITHYPKSPVHPMYHILMAEFMAGSARSFFEQDCAENLPFGQDPWPCHNPVCSGYLKDVINSYDANPYSGCMHARFECPLCGMIYHRKKAMPKDDQYVRRPKIFDYGPLWDETLRQCLVEKKMTARETSWFMRCDFYTVNRHALDMGIAPIDGVHLFTSAKKEKAPVSPGSTPLSDEDIREKHRKRWLDLIERNPGIIRSRLIELDRSCHIWLRKNDLVWYEAHSPPARYAHFDWETCDTEVLEKVRSAIEEMWSLQDRPKWISRNAVITATGCHQISNRKALSRIPRTAAFLDENLESADDWRKRKIGWAIEALHKQEIQVTLSRIAGKAAISPALFGPLASFATECLNKE